MKLKFFFTLLCIGSLISCTTTATESATTLASADNNLPQWVSQPPSAANHLYGVGSAKMYGNDPTQARERAEELGRLDLLQTLRVSISASTEFNQQAENGTLVQNQLINNVRSQVPEVEIEGLEVLETYVDETNKQVFTLIHLDRDNAAARLQQRIGNIDTELNSYYNTPNNSSTVKNLQALMPALQLTLQREKHNETLRLLHPAGETIAKPETLIALEQRIYKLLDALTVTIRGTSSVNDAMASALREQLTKAGFRITNQSNADVRLVYDLNISQDERGDRHFALVHATLDIQDSQRRSLKTLSRDTKGVSNFANSARDKGVTKAGNALGKDLAENLLDYLR